MPRTSKKSAQLSAQKQPARGGHEKGADHMIELMRGGQSMTFAQMLQFQPQVMRRLKLPPWWNLFLTYERKDQATLTPTEQSRFLCALSVLIANGTYGKLV